LLKISRVDVYEIGSVIDFWLDWGVDDVFYDVILRIEGILDFLRTINDLSSLKAFGKRRPAILEGHVFSRDGFGIVFGEFSMSDFGALIVVFILLTATVKKLVFVFELESGVGVFVIGVRLMIFEIVSHVQRNLVGVIQQISDLNSKSIFFIIVSIQIKVVGIPLTIHILFLSILRSISRFGIFLTR
jgi:hypothetical protein